MSKNILRFFSFFAVTAILSLSLAVEYSYWKYHIAAPAISVVFSIITFR